MYQALIETELSATIGAQPWEHTPSRTNQRNGSRPRILSTTAGDLRLRIPKLCTGSFFPALLDRRRRVDQALFAVIMEAYLHGVSTRKVDDLVQALGVASGISKSEVSRICAELDDQVAAFRGRSLRATSYPDVFLDATYCKARSTTRSSPRPWSWNPATGIGRGGADRVPAKTGRPRASDSARNPYPGPCPRPDGV